jgi:conjugal transfer pilus assembly protein TraF
MEGEMMSQSRHMSLLALLLTTALPAAAQSPEAPAITSETAQPALASAAPQDVIGDDFYCKQRKLGTHFYCERPKPKSSEPRAVPPAPPVSYAAQLKELQARIEETRAKAVLAPTTENITAYIAIQREQLDRSSYFADIWQRAIWANPNLDYTLQRPVSTLGKRLWADTREQDKTALLANLSKRYGLYYFFAQSCSACDVFAPILKGFTKSHNMSVLAVSMDGGPTRIFPDYVVDSGQHRKFGLSSKATPALVLYDTLTKRAQPVGYGVMAADEIASRIYALVGLKPGSDY